MPMDKHDSLWQRLKYNCWELWDKLTHRQDIDLDDTFVDDIQQEDTMVGRLSVRHVCADDDREHENTQMFRRVGEPAAKPHQKPAKPHHLDEPEQLFVKNGKKPRPFALSVLFASMRFAVVIALVLGFFCLGLGLGVAKAYVETTPELDPALLTKSNLTSYIYDKDGKLITTFAGMEYRDWASISEIPDMLINAVIAVEDVRFYKHEGVDYKRLFSAVINTLRNTDTHGGSTITQQLIKNKVLSSAQTYKRKIQEAYLAVELETVMEKAQILEAYLNDVFLGESNYGMKTAAMDYFGKPLAELSIRECAMLAGMIQKPYVTDPRNNTYKRTLDKPRLEALERAKEDGLITSEQYANSKNGNNRMFVTDQRTNVVLSAMYTGGFISREQYDSAMNETVNIQKDSPQSGMYSMPYFVEYAIRDVITNLLEKRGLLDTKANRSAIENELRTGGYHIYTTVDVDVQNTVQDTLSTWKEYPDLADPSAGVKVTTNADGSTLEVVQPQAAAVVFDYHTGELRAIVGGRDTPTLKKEWNRAYQSATPVGSSIKPIAVYGPALDLGASPSSVIYNFPGKIEGYGGAGFPNIGNSKYMGPVTIREGVVQSLNIVAARTLFEWVTPDKSRDYLVSMGVDPSRINVDGPGLALGTSGITPIEMAAAYGAIGAGGEYKQPLSFTKVLDSGGNVILSADDVRQTHRVFQKTTAYMLIDILEDAVARGTGARAKIPNMTVAGKTGTNSDYSSVYFAGITPYYSAAVWVGHDDYSKKLRKSSSGGKYAAPLWQSFMKKIHTGLKDKPIMEESPQSIGLVKLTTCPVSGLLATPACFADSMGNKPVTDWHTEGVLPTEYCKLHALVAICPESHLQATANCPNATDGSIVLVPSSSPLRQFAPSDLKAAIPNMVFSDIPADIYGSANFENSALCPIHGGFNPAAGQLRQALVAADKIINDIHRFIISTPTLEGENGGILNAAIQSVTEAKASSNAATIMSAVGLAQSQLNAIRGDTPGTLPDFGW